MCFRTWVIYKMYETVYIVLITEIEIKIHIHSIGSDKLT